MRKIVFIGIFITFVTTLCFGQGGTAAQDAARERAFRESKESTEEEHYKTTERVVKFYQKENLPENDRIKLNPQVEDTVQHQKFLKDSKTGIFKIFNNLNCNEKVIDLKRIECLNAVQILGNGSFYSFTEKTNFRDMWADIWLDKGLLKVNFNARQMGIISDLGDADIEKLSLNSVEIKQLKDLSAPINSADYIQKRNIVLAALPIKSGKTFALRIIGMNDDSNAKKYPNSKLDRLLVMRVIRQETDESFTIIWKELERKKAQKLSN